MSASSLLYLSCAFNFLGLATESVITLVSHDHLTTLHWLIADGWTLLISHNLDDERGVLTFASAWFEVSTMFEEMRK